MVGDNPSASPIENNDCLENRLKEAMAEVQSLSDPELEEVTFKGQMTE